MSNEEKAWRSASAQLAHQRYTVSTDGKRLWHVQRARRRISALTSLQRQAPAEQLPADRLKALMAQAVGEGDLSRSEELTVERVALLFEHMLADVRLAPPLRALLLSLQIPLLKCALAQPRLLGAGDHPLPQLLNEIGRAATGWNEPAQPERDSLYRQIDRLIVRIQVEFEDDSTLFSRLLEEFREFLAHEATRTRLNEERTRQAAEGKARLEEARLTVAKEIRQRIGQRQLPTVVRTLLERSWPKVLFIALVQDEGGDEWRRQLDVVDRLLWSLEPKTSAAERKELLVEVPGLLFDLQQGLRSIHFSSFEMSALLRALQAEHVRSLLGARKPACRQAQAVHKPSARVAAQLSTSGGEDMHRCTRQLQEIPLGTWFEMAQGNGKRVRAKLLAQFAGGTRLLFVNRAGFKVADKPLAALARELAQGAAVVLEARPLFDTALAAVEARRELVPAAR